MDLNGRAAAIGAAVLLSVGLGGCAQTTWIKPGVDEARRDADLARCESHARQETEDDFVSRMEETHRGVVAGTDALYSRDDLRRFDVYDRRVSITEACMRQLGYTAVDSGQSILGGGPAADPEAGGEEPEVGADDL